MATITIDDLSTISSLATGDKVSVWDISAGEHKTITLSNLVTTIAGETDLLDLNDTPASYSTGARLPLTVKSTEDGVEFSEDLYITTVTLGATSQPSASVPFWIRENDVSGTAITTASATFERNTEAAIHLLTNTNGVCRIYAGDSGDEDAGIIEYDHSNQRWEFWTEGSIRMRVEAGHVRPNADNSIDLGSSTLAWQDIYYEGTLNDTSDRRYKNNIIEEELGLDFIRRLKPVTYTMKSDARGLTHHGFIAQDIEATGDTFHGVRLNREDDNEKYTLDYTQLIAPLVKAVQEMSDELEQYRGEI